MKLIQFDLKKAKEGVMVITRDYQKARIICFDCESSDDFCIVALLYCRSQDCELAIHYNSKGKSALGAEYPEKDSSDDLLLIADNNGNLAYSEKQKNDNKKLKQYYNFFVKVAVMRANQKEFFHIRERATLEKIKKSERAVDEMIHSLMPPDNNLFLA